MWRMAANCFLTGLTRLTGLGFSWSFELGIRPLRVVATHRKMCLRRSRQVTRGRRPSPVGAARGRATKPSDREAEFENGR
jgi:hypothetical protein